MRAILRPCLILLLAGGCMSYMSEPRSSITGFKATLSGQGELPPIASQAGGYMKGEYSNLSHILKWQIYVNGLSSPMTRGYFHGPDGMSGEAGVVELNLPFADNALIGSATLTEQQTADLLAGRWYLDIQTQQYPNGEIRGAVVPRK